MKRKWAAGLLAWLFLLGVAGADGEVTAELAQVDTSKYPEVTLYVGVRDRDGQIVEGLQQGDFRVTEDGTPVEIIAFNAGISSAIATVLTIDRSNSMSVENKLEGAKRQISPSTPSASASKRRRRWATRASMRASCGEWPQRPAASFTTRPMPMSSGGCTSRSPSRYRRSTSLPIVALAPRTTARAETSS